MILINLYVVVVVVLVLVVVVVVVVVAIFSAKDVGFFPVQPLGTLRYHGNLLRDPFTQGVGHGGGALQRNMGETSGEFAKNTDD